MKTPLKRPADTAEETWWDWINSDDGDPFALQRLFGNADRNGWKIVTYCKHFGYFVPPDGLKHEGKSVPILAGLQRHQESMFYVFVVGSIAEAKLYANEHDLPLPTEHRSFPSLNDL